MEDRLVPDFFISSTAADRPWAEWIAGVLSEAGLTAVHQSEDIRPGNDFLHEMQRASVEARRTLAVLSSRYLTSHFSALEAWAALGQDPSGELRLLIPVRVEDFEPPGMLRTRVYVDLVGLDEQDARAELLRGVATSAPPARGTFPGRSPARGADGQHRPAAFPRAPVQPQDQGPPSPERVPWDRLRAQSPELDPLMRQDRRLLGHGEVRRLLSERRDGADPVSLVLLSGPAGSGKSSVLRWLEAQAGVRVVHVSTVLQQLRRQLRGPALEVEVDDLVDQLRPAVAAAGPDVVLAYDDADHDLLHQSVLEFIRAAFEELDPGLLVVTTSTALATELFPVPARARTLDRRAAGFDEFDEFVDRALDATGTDRAAFTGQVRENLYDLSEQTPDFRTVHQVLAMLVAYQHSTGRSVRPTVLRDLLEDEGQAHSLQLPELAGGRRLTFRRKDKSELLAALFFRLFPEPSDFAQVATATLDGFDAEGFRAEAARSERAYRHALTSLCLTHSPGDLVLALLTPEQVRAEVRALHLDPAQLIGAAEDQAHLLVRGLGFTLVDPPVGLNAFKAAVTDARALVEDQDKGTETLTRAAAAVAEHVDAALRDLLHFWATYLFDSVGDLVRSRNARAPQRPPLHVRSLTTADVVDLLHFLNVQALGEDFRFRLSSVELVQPLSAALLAACDSFAVQRSVFEDPSQAATSDPAPKALREQCTELVASAAELLERAGDGSFPTVIKLSEIVFDEYSRRIFRGVDSEGNEVRFGITERQDLEDLEVAAHYYMLPFKRVSVNPRIVPRAGRRPHVLFDNGKRYAAASRTQEQQGHKLLSFVDLAADERVIEVGCGTGALAVEVGARVGHLHCIDVSPEMLSVAEDRIEEAGLATVTFEAADLLDYEVEEPYDLVLSNSTMHWILPSERAYERLHRLVRPGGRLAVHQGGYDNYRGLRECARRVVRRLRLEHAYVGWKYPVYYPTPVELRDLLVSVGFADVTVHDVETDGSESPSLVYDFSAAGLLPFLSVLHEAQHEVFRTAFLEEAANRPPDLYTHRLYVTARRP